MTVSRETPEPPPPLPGWLTPATDGLSAFVQALATDGVARGLLGPREVPRLWTRHVLNCAVVADPALGLVPPGARVADVGSGAGLPGVAWAIVRSDLSLILVEPLLRRATFLTELVVRLGLGDRVEIARVRAEDLGRDPSWHPADVVTARAVAPLDRLLGWTIPLVRPGGQLLALKGSSAAAEVADARGIARGLGVGRISVLTCGAGVVEPATTVIVAERIPA